jgi:hypothetical protein
MPPVSERQRRFMGAELARKRAGKRTETGMSEEQLREYARKPETRRATRGSPPAAAHELQQGYRLIGRYPVGGGRR